ncbi:MAG: nickel pincer cofactor biosynthesis protein LarC [Bacteroidales bacterium]|nr:nickel pincer cofactor biosynthesis protein LarC [Bacteroidales bacterium]
MKILYYDCFSGISGDMNLGAMIDLGVDAGYLKRELDKLNIKGWELEVNIVRRNGIKGMQATVIQKAKTHEHRHFSDILEIIEESSLDDKTKNLSTKIFTKLAEAESTVHGIAIEEVHFHEVGAIDSIIDIVGAAICFNALKVDHVYVSTIELGGGTVKCDHGAFPVPAPATAEILKNIPVNKDGVDFEATTPTGAAILAVLGNTFGRPLPFKILKTGYGAGHKEHPAIPNLLRVFLGEILDRPNAGHEAMLLECNIDDMNPEFYEYISEKLFKTGASDVFLTGIIMKKSRPGTTISVICEKEIAGQLMEILFTESTTLGIRCFTFLKETLSRETFEADTEFGKVRYKRSFYKGKEVSCKPEYDDCKRIAEETGRPIREIYNILTGELFTNKE